jgi:hypothetical protein
MLPGSCGKQWEQAQTKAIPPKSEAIIEVAESATEAVLQATDTRTISRSATSAAGMSNNTGQPEPLAFQESKSPKLTSIKTAPRLVLLAIYAQLDLTGDDPAILAAKEVEIHGRRVATQFLSTANCPLRDGISYVVLWDASSIDEQACDKFSYFAWSRINRREGVVRGLGILKLLGGGSLPHQRSGAHITFFVVHDGNSCSSLVLEIHQFAQQEAWRIWLPTDCRRLAAACYAYPDIPAKNQECLVHTFVYMQVASDLLLMTLFTVIFSLTSTAGYSAR